MAGSTIYSPSQRVNKVKGEILAHAVPREVLGITGQLKSMPKNQGNTIVYRRYLPFGGATTNATTINTWSVTASAHLLAEGITPTADSLTPQDITVVLQQYGCVYQYSDVVNDLYEDDLPAEQKKQVGERMGLVRELVRYGAVRGSTNKFYGGGGTSRATVAGPITYNLLNKISRSILGNRGDPITRVLAPSSNFNTSAVEAGFLVFCHTDGEHDIRGLPNFIEVAKYGTRKPVHEMELGSAGRYRFILSPELGSYADAGAAIGSTGMYTTTGTSMDVYPFIVVADNAWGEVVLRGSDSFDFTNLKPGQKDKNDILGQRGYVGAKFYSAATVLNDGWMAVLEAGVTSL
jgi:N4-gp56 family major capsid protein